MAYKSLNHLKNVLWVQETYWENRKEITGLSNKEILKRYINIEGRRPIAARTLYTYLGIPAKRLLKEMGVNVDEIKKPESIMIRVNYKIDGVEYSDILGACELDRATKFWDNVVSVKCNGHTYGTRGEIKGLLDGFERISKEKKR